MQSIGTLIGGRYEITGNIGHGGMSYVYRARDIYTGADLAIKESIKRGEKGNQLMEQNLATEGNLLKRLDNPHLPKIYEVIEDRDNIMIVMDYIEGQSLDKEIEQFGAMSTDRVVDYTIQICEVFHYLHTQNPPIIYRDMKPANIILQPNGHIMMIDFGTARTWKIDASKTSDTMLIGTEGFAAPEQFGGMGQTDARTDIFCLGATMFNLITGHNPYEKPFGITPLEKWSPEFKNSALNDIIQKATRKDPNERYQTALELRDAVIQSKESLKRLGFGWRKKNTSVSSGESKAWQQSPMEETKGRSAFLRARNVSGRSKELPNRVEVSKSDVRNVGQVGVNQSSGRSDNGWQRNQYSGGNPNHVNNYQEQMRSEVPAIDTPKSNLLWKVLMLICFIEGIVLFALGIVFVVLGATAGIILLVIALLLLILGAVSTFKYINS